MSGALVHSKWLRSIARRCIAAMGLAYAATSTAAFAETTGGGTVSASAGFDSNPFLGVDNDQEVASFRLEFAPALSYSDGLTEINLQSRVEHIEYLGNYDSVQNLSTSLAAKHRVNERTTLTASIGLASTVSQGNFTELQSVPGQPLNPGIPNVLVDDITLLGRQTRQISFTAGSSIIFQPGQFDELSYSADLSLQRYKNNSGLDDYDYGSQRLSYTRQINENISLGGLFEYSVGNFKSTGFGDTQILSPKFLVKARLGSRFDFNSSLGAAFTSVETPQGQLSVTSIAGSASLCYRGEQDSFCMNGQRQTVPTAVGGVRTLTSLGTSYSVRLSNRDTFQTGTSYSKASAPIIGGTTSYETVQIFGRLERRLNDRARIFVSGGYTNSSDGFFGSRSNVQALLGISISYGRI